MHKPQLLLFSALRLFVTLLLGLCGWLALPAQAALTLNAADNTVTDSSTSLVWDRCALGLSGSDCKGGAPRVLNWSAAMTAAQVANAANYQGHADWRLPNIKELGSLLDFQKGTSAIDSTMFPASNGVVFWSSTQFAGAVTQAWNVIIMSNFSSSGHSDKSSTNRVRLVRGGQPLAAFDSQALLAPTVALTVIAPASLTYGSTGNLASSGGSGTGAVTYSVGSSTGCAVNGTTLSVINASGTCAVTASKAADSQYSGATSASVSVALKVASQATLTVIAPASLTSGSTGNLSSSGGSGTGAVTYSVGGSTGCAVTSTTLSLTNVTGSGTCTVTASKAADSNYSVATSAPVTVMLGADLLSPTVTAINPSRGSTAGGISVTLTGSNLTGATSVTIGGNACTALSAITNTTITCTTPAGNVGPASVLVTASGSNTDNTLFTYVPSDPLNDTGQSLCIKDSSAKAVWETCTAANSGPTATVPGQDGRYGRDAAFAAGKLTKIGGGSGGFDFTRICFNGAAEGTTSGSKICTGTLVANTTATASSTPETDWACTKDNVTNLVWSLQNQSANWTTASASAYPDAGHNSVSRCGGTGWRLPTLGELTSIIHFDRDNPSIDTTWFPGTANSGYWTSDVLAGDSSNAWVVDFYDGVSYYDGKYSTHQVRLVRGGQ